jgi:hypothetical protein
MRADIFFDAGVEDHDSIGSRENESRVLVESSLLQRSAGKIVLIVTVVYYAVANFIPNVVILQSLHKLFCT